MEDFGPRLRRLRLGTGLSPSALAHAVGVTEGAIRQMESGQTRFASFPVGVRLAEALGVKPRYLAFGDEKDKGEALRPVDRLSALERRVAALDTAVRQQKKSPGPRSKKSR
jgi:transcriptional regulator with XRE-family HTH domain